MVNFTFVACMHTHRHVHRPKTICTGFLIQGHKIPFIPPKNETTCGLQTYSLNIFLQDYTGPLAQYNWRPSLKLGGPGFSKNSNLLQHYYQALALLKIEIRDP